MKRIKIVALGGSHTIGHPLGPTHAFPVLLTELLGGEVAAQVGHLQFVRLAEHFATIEALQPTHVVL